MNIAEWLSAAAAVGALIAAWWAAKTSVKLFKIETSRDRASEERAEMEQASGIAGWCVFAQDREKGHQKGIQLHNSSDAPVYDVVVESTYAATAKGEAQPLQPIRLSVLPPGDYVVFEHPEYHWAYAEERAALPTSVRPVSKNPKWVVGSVAFTDAHGVKWVRRGGALRRLDQATGPAASGA